MTAAGTCTITASIAGDATYDPITSAPFTVTINKGTQTIAFGSLFNSGNTSTYKTNALTLLSSMQTIESFNESMNRFLPFERKSRPVPHRTRAKIAAPRKSRSCGCRSAAPPVSPTSPGLR